VKERPPKDNQKKTIVGLALPGRGEEEPTRAVAEQERQILFWKKVLKKRNDGPQEAIEKIHRKRGGEFSSVQEERAKRRAGPLGERKKNGKSLEKGEKALRLRGGVKQEEAIYNGQNKRNKSRENPDGKTPKSLTF